MLLSHLVLFLFVYPSERDQVPAWVWRELLSALQEERGAHDNDRICRGTLLSRGQYLEALERGSRDPRLPPEGTMRHKDVVAWTNAAIEEGHAP